MPKIDRVDTMRKAPGRCGICHTTPNDVEGRPLPAIDTNVDVDWGNNLYICSECMTVMGELMGWVTPDVHQQLQVDYRKLSKDHSRLRDRYKELESRLKTIIAGRKAERNHREKVRS